MKHLKPRTKKLPIRAEQPVLEEVVDPCFGLSGKQLKKCRKENPES